MKEIEIYTDGACFPNPGKGAWGWVSGDLSGADTVKFTTNNRMEMLAVIKAVEANKNRGYLKVYSDSMYVVDGVNKWIDLWEENNWKNGKIKNQDLWEWLKSLRDNLCFEINWVRGHNGHPENERVDALVNTLVDVPQWVKNKWKKK